MRIILKKIKAATKVKNKNLPLLTKPNVWILIGNVHALWLTRSQCSHIIGQERNNQNNKHFLN